MEVRPGYKQTEVGVIPADWKVASVAELALKVGSGITPTGGQRIYRDHGRPFVRSQNVGWGSLLLDDLVFIDESTHLTFPDTEIHRDDVLLNITGASIGRSALADLRVVGGNVNQHVCIIRSNPQQLVASYLNMFLLSAGGQHQIDSFQAGGNRQGLNFGQVRSMRMPLPPTEAEQRAIATALSDVDALLGGLDRLIAKKRDLKQAAMQQLLTGQTRLPGFHGEWEVVEFGNIASIRNLKVVASSAPPGTHCVELESIDSEGRGRLLFSADATGMSAKYSFKKGDVLFGRLRAYLRKFWLATFDGLCSTEIWPLTARDERLCGSFLYLLIQTDDFASAAGVSYGTHMPRSDWSILKKLFVRLPPASEQTAIAAVLSDMDTELGALEARRDKTRALKQAMMQELLTGRTRLV